jgi:hypothetical protein
MLEFNIPGDFIAEKRHHYVENFRFLKYLKGVTGAGVQNCEVECLVTRHKYTCKNMQFLDLGKFKKIMEEKSIMS